MKKTTRFLALSLILALALLLVPAGAQDVTGISAILRPAVKIELDGYAQEFYNASGEQVFPIFYNDTHYLPIRAIGELMGKNVNWDQAALTISLDSPRTAETVKGHSMGLSAEVEITAQVRPDFKIYVDGTLRSFVDGRGDTVYPILYEGTTYLPLRAIGELMDKDVTWYEKALVITLTTKDDTPIVTDADSFNQTESDTAAQPPSQGVVVPPDDFTMDNPPALPDGLIGYSRAEDVALAAAGLSRGQVTALHASLDEDDGRWEYEVEFYHGTTEYEYEVDAFTGDVRERDKESIYD